MKNSFSGADAHKAYLSVHGMMPGTSVFALFQSVCTEKSRHPPGFGNENRSRKELKLLPVVHANHTMKSQTHYRYGNYLGSLKFAIKGCFLLTQAVAFLFLFSSQCKGRMCITEELSEITCLLDENYIRPCLCWLLCRHGIFKPVVQCTFRRYYRLAREPVGGVGQYLPTIFGKLEHVFVSEDEGW